MDAEKQKALENAGWKLGDAEDFLDNVSPSNIVVVMAERGLIVSHSEARRLILQKAVSVNGVLIEDLMAEVKKDDVIRVGKRKQA